VLRLKPNPTQAVALLSQVGSNGNQKLFQEFLKPIAMIVDFQNEPNFV